MWIKTTLLMKVMRKLDKKTVGKGKCIGIGKVLPLLPYTYHLYTYQALSWS